jgi:hypothetical protein
MTPDNDKSIFQLKTQANDSQLKTQANEIEEELDDDNNNEDLKELEDLGFDLTKGKVIWTKPRHLLQSSIVKNTSELHSPIDFPSKIRVLEHDCSTDINQSMKILEMQLDDGTTRSIVRVDKKDVVILSNLCDVLAGLAFCRSMPARVLVLGLWGGSLVNYLRVKFPSAHIDVVEQDATVVEAARELFKFQSDTFVSLPDVSTTSLKNTLVSDYKAGVYLYQGSQTDFLSNMCEVVDQQTKLMRPPMTEAEIVMSKFESEVAKAHANNQSPSSVFHADLVDGATTIKIPDHPLYYDVIIQDNYVPPLYATQELTFIPTSPSVPGAQASPLDLQTLKRFTSLIRPKGIFIHHSTSFDVPVKVVDCMKVYFPNVYWASSETNRTVVGVLDNATKNKDEPAWVHPIETDTLVDAAVQQWEFGNMTLEVLAHTDNFKYCKDSNLAVE